MIFVGGISSSGKTHTIAMFVADHDYFHVKASAVLSEIGRPIKSLTFSEAELNQQYLLRHLEMKGLISPHTILDGHVIIETVEGIYPVPEWFFSQAQISKIICVTEDPRVIQDRRKSLGQILVSDSNKLQDLQELELRLAAEQAERLGIDCRQVSAGRVDDFAATVLAGPR